jgi:hypothetical protein
MGMRERWRREEWGVFVRAKQEFDALSVTGGNDDACRVRFPDHAACYFPQKRAKSRFFDVCRDVAKDKGARPLLIVGDLNTGNQMSDRTPSGTNTIAARISTAYPRERVSWTCGENRTERTRANGHGAARRETDSDWITPSETRCLWIVSARAAAMTTGHERLVSAITAQS